ncbi:uncharacterized protein LOC116187118 [Punica granatum]|uniref:Uncharacterized protein LOC116187118 n=2 Tax=Punica granatum TaxID=22663 RepID=A0A6P8BPI8_PUNGR|nr:uncharacterized protein LOC116187118 [Punica granatum]PKI71710.1 hypothetical protein CRG98_007843 [Punica granatum]
MEQRKSAKNGCAGERNSSGKEDDVVGQVEGSPVHSQVRKIKREEKTMVDWSPGQPELRPALREITRQISRSRLGLGGRAISVGDP